MDDTIMLRRLFNFNLNLQQKRELVDMMKDIAHGISEEDKNEIKRFVEYLEQYKADSNGEYPDFDEYLDKFDITNEKLKEYLKQYKTELETYLKEPKWEDDDINKLIEFLKDYAESAGGNYYNFENHLSSFDSGNEEFNQYIKDHAEQLKKYLKDDNIDALKDDINKKFSDINDDFFNISDAISELQAYKNEVNAILESIQKALHEEIERSTAKDSKFHIDLNLETIRAKIAEKVLENKIKQLSEGGDINSANLTNKINEEKSRAEAAEGKIQESLNAEINRSKLRDNDLESKITNEIVRAKLSEKEIYDDLESQVEAEADLARTLEKGIKNELTKKIEKEKSDIWNAHNTLSNEYDKEKKLREANDNGLFGTTKELLKKCYDLDKRIDSISKDIGVTDEEVIEAAKEYIDEQLAEYIKKTMTVKAVQVDSGTEPSATYDSGTNTLTINIPKGEKGETGERGPSGADGERGVDGTPGSIGPAGPQGADGKVWKPSYDSDSGELSWTLGDAGEEESITPVNIKGPKGDKGDNGANGADGQPGPQGPAGTNGEIGPQGKPGKVYKPSVGEDGTITWNLEEEEEASTPVESDVQLLSEVPEDNKLYIRKKGEWVPITKVETVTSLTSLPIDAYSIKCTLSESNSTGQEAITFNGTPAEGWECMIDIKNAGSTDITVNIPNEAEHWQCDVASIVIPSNKIGCISIRYIHDTYVVFAK